MSDDNPFYALIPIIIFGAPVAAWIVSRVLAHQERMEYIRRGMQPPPSGGRGIPPYQQWQPGPGPMPGSVPPPPAAMYGPDPYSFAAQAQMRKGVTVTMIGFALLIGLSFIDHRPGPWLLGGLIPMFVGIAQIINAMMNGARFPWMMTGGGYQQSSVGSFGPRPQGGAPAGVSEMPPPPSQAGSYGWRPGPTPEIEKPVTPPAPQDYR